MIAANMAISFIFMETTVDTGSILRLLYRTRVQLQNVISYNIIRIILENRHH